MSIKQSYLFFFVATVIAVALRTLMLYFAIDTASGFIKSEYFPVSVAIIAIIVVAVALIFVFSILTKQKAAVTLPDGIAYKLICPILAAVILYDTFFSTIDHSVTSWQRSLEFIFSILAAVALISFTVLDLFHYDFPPILTAAPILFWFIRLVIIFTSFSTLANIVDNMFELAALCMILVSSLQCSKLACIDLSHKKQTLVLAVLLSTASICFVTSIPRAIVILSGNAALLHRNDLPLMTTFAAGVYFLIICINCYPLRPGSRH